MLSQPQKVLILKFGALGDLILITPSLRRLRAHYPSALISLLCLEEYGDVLKKCPYLNEILTFNKDSLIDQLSLVREVKKENFDLLIDIQNSKRSHILGALCGIPKRLGFKRDWGRYFLTHAADGFKNDLSPVKHQFQILECLNLKEDTEKLEVYYSKQDEEKVSELLRSCSSPRHCERGEAISSLRDGIATGSIQEPSRRRISRLIGIHPFASSRWKSKVWPTTHYVELVEKINKFFGGSGNTVFILTGSQQDYWRGEELRLLLKGSSCMNLMGTTSYGELVALIKRLNYFITVDSAPLHIATALNIPTLAFFGPTNPKKHYVPTDKTKLLYKEVLCGPCYKPNCPEGHHNCLKGISAKDVAITQFLEMG